MPILLFIILLTTTLLFTNGIVFIPEYLLRSLHLPFWFSVGGLVLLLAWLIGD
ncbi:hypothetical protein IFO70_13625 [Phormidium tenue FACHB-886]|nr:hypothetical protein [Phormidium tenue FACHB-886]